VISPANAAPAPGPATAIVQTTATSVDFLDSIA